MDGSPQAAYAQVEKGLIVAGFLFGLATIAALLVYAIVNESWRSQD